MTYIERRTWALTCETGSYLTRYDASDDRDDGSRCGMGDDELDAVGAWLASRGLRLVADDRGLCSRGVASY